MFIIGGVQKSTLIDYPKKIAAIVFTKGCNFRCGYCHNPELITASAQNNEWTVDSFFDFLSTRQGKLDGVVITGGEPTLQPGLYNFVKEINNLGFLVKLDTNGTNPHIVEKLISDNLLDYIAMDIKAPLEKYSNITGVNENKENIQKSIEMIMTCGVDYEFRTTVIKSQITRDDFVKIGHLINGAKKYYLQKFIPSKIYDNSLINEISYSENEFKEICTYLTKYIDTVDFR